MGGPLLQEWPPLWSERLVDFDGCAARNARIGGAFVLGYSLVEE
jgi:hypothetical protein